MIEPEEDFQQRKCPQHSPASSWGPPVNNNKQPPPPPSPPPLTPYCWGGRQYFRTGLLLFQSILKLHSCVHPFAERLTGGLYLFLCLLQRDYIISCFQLKWLATVPSSCDHPSAAAAEHIIWEETKRMSLAEKGWIIGGYLRFHISVCKMFGMSPVKINWDAS